MENRTDNTDSNAKKAKGLNALMIALVSVFGAIAVLMIALIVTVTVTSLSRTEPKPNTDEFVELVGRYKYNAVELYDSVGNRYGSAFVYTRDGETLYLFTNYHVTGEDTSALQARFYGRNAFEKTGELEQIGYSKEYDISLLKTKIFPENPYVDIRAQGVVRSATQGAKILCLGNNLGYGIQAQNGIVSTPCIVTNPQKSHDGEPSYTIAVIGACAPLNSGNSGAAVYDLSGGLVGMNTWRVTTNSAGDAVCDTCYLTPAPVMAAMFETMVGNAHSGEVDFPTVVMQTGDGGSLYVQALHTLFVFEDYKLTVKRIDATGTDKLSVGDVVTQIGSLKVEPNNFAAIVGELFNYNVWGSGDKLTLKVVRDSKETEITTDELRRVTP